MIRDTRPFAERDVYTVDDIAREWHISKMTVYRWVRDGELANYGLGRSIRIRREDYEEFIKTKRNEVS